MCALSLILKVIYYVFHLSKNFLWRPCKGCGQQGRAVSDSFDKLEFSSVLIFRLLEMMMMIAIVKMIKMSVTMIILMLTTTMMRMFGRECK